MYKIRPSNDELYVKLVELGYNKIVSLLIAQRVDTVEKAMSILKPSMSNLNVDELMDSVKAARLLYSHIENGGLIVIISDYDCDGISANAFTKRALVEYFNVPENKVIQITNEREFKNGINKEMVRRVLEIHSDTPVGLVITVDHGSHDDERYHMFKNKNIDILVTDHHILSKEGIPKNADAFVNPQRPDDNFSKDISGATVSYFVMKQLYKLFEFNDRELGKQDELLSLLPIVALTIISDQMSLQDPINRILLKQGLDEINKLKDTPWLSLASVGNIEFPINEDDIGFGIAPIMNAGGRMGDADLATMFLSEVNYAKSKDYLRRLINLNKERKDLQNRLLTIANKQVPAFTNRFKHTIVNVLPEGHGVGGIIASMIGDRYLKPTIVLSDVGEGVLMGSGRAVVDQFDIKQALDYVHEQDDTIMVKYGGHTGAAGLEILKKDAMRFFTLFDKATELQLNEKGIATEDYYYDLELPSKNVTSDIVNIINELAPFGNKWHKPVMSSDFLVKKMFKVGVGRRHLVVKLQPDIDYKTIDAFYPNYDIKKYGLLDSDKASIIYNISMDKNDKVRLLIEDVYKKGNK